VRVLADPADSNRYLTAEGSEEITAYSEEIRVAGADSEILQVRETRWGPILAP
jgi:penicillin amidase